MSLTVEQYFRKACADMDSLPRSGVYIEPRRALMAAVIREETYRKDVGSHYGSQYEGDPISPRPGPDLPPG